MTWNSKLGTRNWPPLHHPPGHPHVPRFLTGRGRYFLHGNATGHRANQTAEVTADAFFLIDERYPRQAGVLSRMHYGWLHLGAGVGAVVGLAMVSGARALARVDALVSAIQAGNVA